jgi:integrase
MKRRRTAMAQHKAGRRGNSEGTVFQRADGRWEAKVSVEGKRFSRYAKTRQEATKKLRELQRLQDQGLPVVTAQMLLKDYLAQWLESIRHRVRPKTWVDYEGAVRLHIAPALGHIKLGKLTPEHISRAWDALLNEGASAHTVEYAHRRLSKALGDALKRQLIYRNPCQAVTPPKPPRREMDTPNVHAINRLLGEARGTEYYEALHTAFYTGLRRGELLALRWRDVDLVMATLSVSRSVYRARGGQSLYQDTKTPKGRRMIDLPSESVLVLRSLRERQEADGALLGYEVATHSPVFRYRDGSPILPRGIS